MLAERGAAVVLGARRADRLDELAQEIRDSGGRAVAVPTDVTRPGDLRRLVDSAVTQFGRLDVLVGNAGISEIGPVADLDMNGWSAMIDVNLRGVLRTTAVSTGYVRTELADSIDDPEVREQIRRNSDAFAIPPDAVTRAIAFAIDQPDDVEIGDITIRPTVQG